MSPSVVGWRPRQARRRALVKTGCYRLLVLGATVAVARVGGDVSEAVSVGVAANLVETGADSASERLWDRIVGGFPAVSRGKA